MCVHCCVVLYVCVGAFFLHAYFDLRFVIGVLCIGTRGHKGTVSSHVRVQTPESQSLHAPRDGPGPASESRRLFVFIHSFAHHTRSHPPLELCRLRSGARDFSIIMHFVESFYWNSTVDQWKIPLPWGLATTSISVHYVRR